MKLLTAFCILSLLVFSGCIEDYDVAEVAPEEHLHTEHQHEHGETCEECDNPVEQAGEEVQHAGGSSPSGHNHAAGSRNHGTQWFFNQPWAAPFIWGKLARDGAVFLVLACVIFFVTGRKKR